MSQESLESFRAEIWKNAEEMQSLREVEDRAEMTARLIELGRTAGFNFEASDVEAVMRENQLSWMQRWA